MLGANMQYLCKALLDSPQIKDQNENENFTWNNLGH